MGQEKPEIQRIDSYQDPRFSQRVLDQHGAFLVDGEPYEVEIMGEELAQVRGARRSLYGAVVEEFRFYTGHICRFYDAFGHLIREYPSIEAFAVKLKDIQPSQFYVDRDKLAAVLNFVKEPEDIIIPVTAYGDRFISQDGHTRLVAAVELGFDRVYAFTDRVEDAQFNEILCGFVKEAQRKGICSPYDLKVLPHEEYEVKWNQFCDEYFERMDQNT